MSSHKTVPVVAVSLILSFLVLSVLINNAAYGTSSTKTPHDFNSDGYEDLVVGTYREDIGAGNSLIDAGSVNVIHGSAIGLSATFDSLTDTGMADQEWTQNSPSIQSAANIGDQFGDVVAAGDFNDDGFSDVVIGVPSERVAGQCCDVGGVNIIYGTATGLAATGDIPNQVFTQNSPNIQGVAGPDERFGDSLAVGDFNNDGYDDLVIGVPEEAITTNSGTFDNAGVINVIYGSSGGLSASATLDGSGRSDQLWSQNTAGIEDIPYQAEFFGSSLTSGDFNNDGYDDLAIGVRGEGTSSVFDNQGAVNVIYGSPTGLSATFVPDQFFQQGLNGVDGQAIPDEQYGYALASGDFDDDGYDDLAISVPGDLGGMGSVNIIHGTLTGLSALSRSDVVWHGDDGGNNDLIGGPSKDLGRSLAAGNFNGDNYDDLAIGSPNNGAPTPGTVGEAEAGTVNVIYGSPDGLSTEFVPDQFWHQNSPNIQEAASEQEFFGYTIATGDYNGDGYDELAIGIPREDVSHDSIDLAGAVEIIYGSSAGLSAIELADGTGMPDQIFTQNSPNVEGTAEENDFFGWSLA